MKKAVLCMVTLLLCLCAIAAQAQALTLTGLETESVAREWENHAFFERMRELTGVEMEAHGIEDEAEYRKMLAAMEDGTITADVLFKASLSREEEISLLNSGAIIDLAPLIEENMPNLSALLGAHPEWKQVIELEDGRIASLPQLTQEPRQVCVWINSAWLGSLGIDMPRTVDELTQALVKMAGADLNGNGKADEIPADLLGVYEMRWLLPFFGVIADDYNVAREDDGTWVFAPELAGYREFVKTLREWYELGVLPRKAFTESHGAIALAGNDNDTVVSGLIVAVAPYTNVPGSAVFDYAPLLIADPDGQTRWRDLLGGVWTGCFAVTSACPDPASAMRWADALYEQESAIVAYAGVQGEDYDINADGYWYFLVDNYRTINDIRSNAIIYTGETMHGFVPNAFLNRVDSEQDRYVLENSAKVLAVSERVVEPYALGEQTRARLNELAASIGSEVDKGIARFVTGEMELTDENWESWLSGMREAGSEELTALLNAAK